MARNRRIDSNITGLAIAAEGATIGTLPDIPVWERLLPNNYSDFGGELVTVTPAPITPRRRRQKGAVTDLNASGGFNHDLHMSEVFRELLQSVMFGEVTERSPRDQIVSGSFSVDADGGASGVPRVAGPAGTFSGILPGQFIFVGGDAAGTRFASAENNGFKRVSAVAADGSTIDIDKSVMGMEDEGAKAGTRIYIGNSLKDEGLRRSFHLERTLGHSDTAHSNPDSGREQSEVLRGSIANEFSMTIGTAGLVNCDFTFVSTAHDQYPSAAPIVVTVDADVPASANRVEGATVLVVGAQFNPTEASTGIFVDESGTPITSPLTVGDYFFWSGGQWRQTDIGPRQRAIATVIYTLISANGNVPTAANRIAGITTLKVGTAFNPTEAATGAFVDETGGAISGSLTAGDYFVWSGTRWEKTVAFPVSVASDSDVPAAGQRVSGVTTLIVETAFNPTEATTGTFVDENDANITTNLGRGTYFVWDGTYWRKTPSGDIQKLFSFPTAITSDSNVPAAAERVIGRALVVSTAFNPTENATGTFANEDGTSIGGQLTVGDFFAWDGAQWRKTDNFLRFLSVTSIDDSGVFNTSSDFSRIKMASVVPGEVAPQSLFAFLTEMTLNVNNNVTPSKAVGVLGAFDVTAGTFALSGSVTAYFSDIAAVQAVRNNADVTLDFAMVRSSPVEGAPQNYKGLVVDIPLITLGDGRLNVELDSPITLPLSLDAAEAGDAAVGSDRTAVITFFDRLPMAADATTGDLVV